MATREDFTADEWETILQSPTMAGMMVMTAGKSGPIQAVKEMFAVSKALLDADQQGAGGSLVHAIVAAVKAGERPGAPAQQPKSIEEARTMALDHIRRTAALVDVKGPPEDAQAFKRWLVDVGQKVAEASKEGGFLGFGGTQVTDEERAAVGELSAALGIARLSSS
jgi:hypothetical protein